MTDEADVEFLTDRVDEAAANLAGTREEHRGEIRASQARVLTRIASLPQAVHSLKTDISRHAA